ncbi:TetR/AcrR family transcriptional regulator [Catenulispora subtropica]|uniref:TetR/AcrR family transcriptional regulator n=1 Tax=Catenulispora subtropica TaxID=450798 RepID=A0ABP5C5R7_9ACTN
MARTDGAGGGRPEKRQAIVRAATTVFGREGYARASMDAIAAEAGVSKRTIYNHFADKESLFLAVALENSAALTEHIRDLAAQHLSDVSDLRASLLDFAVARAAAVFSAADHGAVGRAIRAEVANLPPDVLTAWLAAGPQASQQDLAGHLERLAARGLLAFDDVGVDVAAEHYTLLTFHPAADRSFWGALPISEDEIRRVAAPGVDAFLRCYGGPELR